MLKIMSNYISELFSKYSHYITYGFFGACTTIINIVSYFFCNSICGIANILSVIIAWFIAIMFAFITNKLWVFGSKSLNRNILLWEFITFYLCRLTTGAVDVMIMYITVDCLHLNSILWKTISNIIAIVANYVASRIVIFNKKNRS